MKTEYSLKDKLKYLFDKSMAAGPLALISWLSLVTLLVIFIAAIFVAIFGIVPEGSEKIGFLEAMWGGLMRSIDAGTIGGDNGWPYRLVSLFVTVSGIFVFSALIGILGSGLEAKLDELRKGRSLVLENDHTIILNWSDSIFDIIQELIIANRSRKKSAIVILADKDKVEMEDEIRAKIENFEQTTIICRSGDPSDLTDLEIVNHPTCRSIIVLSPQNDNPDALVTKSVLALVHNPKRRAEKYQIAAEVLDADNAATINSIGGSEVQTILADDFLSRIMVQSCRQSGLSGVYTELLDFEGCEIYSIKQYSAIGKTFSDIVLSYENSVPIGVYRNGQIKLNPEGSFVIDANDEIVIIAEDDAAIKSGESPKIDASVFGKTPKKLPKKENILILGWNHRGDTIINELGKFVAKGSKLTIGAKNAVDLAICSKNGASNLKIECKNLDITSLREIEGINPNEYDSILVLGYSDELAVQAVDTTTLITLLNIRRVLDESGKNVNVVSEMIDIKNRELAEVTRADDYVVSNKIVSLILAQASENANIAAIFEDLLDEDGAELYLKPIENYLRLPYSGDFYHAAAAAHENGEIAIGYRKYSNNADGKITMNPVKSETISFDVGDYLVVLADS